MKLDENLLTVFIALTALAVVIQAGIVTALYFVTTKISRQAERATSEARRLIDPMHEVLDKLNTTTDRLAEYTSAAPDHLQKTEMKVKRSLNWLRRHTA